MIANILRSCIRCNAFMPHKRQEAKVETKHNFMLAYFVHDELRHPLHVIDGALKLMPDELSVDAQNLHHIMNE
jgi:hypothetical protein